MKIYFSYLEYENWSKISNYTKKKNIKVVCIIYIYKKNYSNELLIKIKGLKCMFNLNFSKTISL